MCPRLFKVHMGNINTRPLDTTMIAPMAENIRHQDLDKEELIDILKGDSWRGGDGKRPCYTCSRCNVDIPFEQKDSIRFGDVIDHQGREWYGAWCGYCWQISDTWLADATDDQGHNEWTTWNELNEMLAAKSRKNIKPAHKK